MFSFMPKKAKKEKKEAKRTKLKHKLDVIFSRFIRFRDCDKNWNVKCPLCWAVIPRKKAQNMHFISRWVMKYRYSEENCHAWCYTCNVTLNGNYIAYTLFMINKFWKEKVEEMKNDKQPYKIESWRMEEMIEEYKWKVEELKKLKHLI